jgi:hypothetical protein
MIYQLQMQKMHATPLKLNDNLLIKGAKCKLGRFKIDLVPVITIDLITHNLSISALYI